MGIHFLPPFKKSGMKALTVHRHGGFYYQSHEPNLAQHNETIKPDMCLTSQLLSHHTQEC